MTKVNGNLIYTFKNEFIKTYGQESFNNLINDMDKESKAILSDSIISGQMYEYTIFNELLDKIREKMGHEEFEEFDKKIVDKQLLFYGFMLKFWPIDKTLNKLKELWLQVYDEGTVTKAENKDGQILLEISDFHFLDPHLITIHIYFMRVAEKKIGRKVDGLFKRIDDRTTQFIYNY